MPDIVTVTLNPAVDVATSIERVLDTRKLRCSAGRRDPGGGGINVARVVHVLGGDALALIMTGGATGHLIEELLDEAGVRWQALPIGGRNRISVNVHDQQSGLEYRFVPEGPEVQPDSWHAALDVLQHIDAEWIVASGSLPRGVPVEFYARAAAIANRRGQKFVLDTSGPALRAALGQDMALLKLSLGELEFLVGRQLSDGRSQEKEVEVLLQSGTARIIAVSLGSAGAILGTKSGMNRLPAMEVPECGAVGAGDSFLAGLVLGLARGLSERKALAFATAAGAAAVATYGTAQVQRDHVEALYRDWCRGESSVDMGQRASKTAQT